MNPIKLTQYSHGAGCGCKISPAVLSQILQSDVDHPAHPNLLVGNDTRDDAAVYYMGDGNALISTTDFFMPIVDDPFLFGQIAATNAISDVYAMGGRPIMAIAILGWPIDKLAPEVANEVIEGGRRACLDAGITLAGGHSIDSPEPIFGLAVNGTVSVSHLKKNSTAQQGDRLYLTKPLGVGILSTAQKKSMLLEDHSHIAPNSMIQLNKVGIDLGEITGVSAMTDVTGFGLLGHLTEVATGSGLTAVVNKEAVPVIQEALTYLAQGAIPGGTHRNWASYGHQISLDNESDRLLLCDPQTSGGLLVSARPEACSEVEDLLRSHSLPHHQIGEMVALDTFSVMVKNKE
ncbi:MAG: selenide, water dikinase SelD [Bacteroidota bacterium]